MSASTRNWRPTVAAAATVVAVTAGGGSGGAAGGGASGSSQGGADDSVGQEFRCSITAEQVGEVLGVPVEMSDGACAFSPGGAAGQTPAAAFLGQLPELCEGDFLEQNGYTERV